MGKSKDLSGHTAIVTGAAGGIGYSFCRELCSRRCDVLMLDIDGKRLQDAAETLGREFPDCRVFELCVDLASEDSVGKIEHAISELKTDPDILINNAGIFNFAPVSELSDSRIDCYIDLHVRAVTELSVWFARKRKGKWSHILNMSSMSCWMPMPGIAMYSSSKAYIRVFSRALDYEVRDDGVMVTVACPGGIATDLFGLPESLKKLAVRLGAITTPERFVRKSIDCMLTGKRQYVNGIINRMAIVAVGITPACVRRLIKRLMLDKGIRV